MPPANQDFNQSDTLIREADEHHVLPKEFWTKHLQVLDYSPMPHITDHGPPLPDDHPLRPRVREFVATMCERLASPKLVSIADQRPAIPQFVDAQLLHLASDQLGGQIEEHDKREVRATFWQLWDDQRGISRAE